MRNKENKQYQPDPDDDYWSDVESANVDKGPVIALRMSIWLPTYCLDKDGSELPEEDVEEWKTEWQKMEEQREREERGGDEEGCERDAMTCKQAFWIRFGLFGDADEFREELEALEKTVGEAFGTWLDYAEAKFKERSSSDTRRVGQRRRPEADGV